MRVQKDNWATKLGVILAVSGSAVGLGNFLRFPGQAAANGGGAFMIPYLVAFLLLGIPICWVEWTMGREGGRRGLHSCPSILGMLGGSKAWKGLGVIGLIIPVIIYMYYVVIEAWCLGYAISYLTGDLNFGTDAAQYAAKSESFFSDLSGAGQDGFLNSEGSIHTTVLIWLGVFTLNFALIYRGVSGGIEKFCKIAIPLMAVCAFCVLIRVLTLGTPDPSFPERNILNGLGAMWNPKGPPVCVEGVGEKICTGEFHHWTHALLDADVWLAATGQIFFSLSVGFGIIINYASYIKKDDDVVLSGLTATSTNGFFEVCLGGLITIPAAFIFLGEATGGTFGLGFNALPVVFMHMPGGAFFGFLWFFMLFLAAITSSLSMLQPAIAFFEDHYNIKRRTSVTLLGALTALGSGFVIYYSEGLRALDTMDFWVGTFLIFTLATIQVVLFSWVIGVDEGIRLASEGAQMKIPKVFRFVVKYISPTYLLLIAGYWGYNELGSRVKAFFPAEGQQDWDPVPLLTVSLIGFVFVLFLVLTLSSKEEV